MFCVYEDKQIDIQTNCVFFKVDQYTAIINMDVVCEFQLNRFNSFAVSWKNGFLCIFTDKKRTNRKTNIKILKKVAQDTPRTNMYVECEFQLNRFSSLGAYSNKHTNK